jgi:hypothetical protein
MKELVRPVFDILLAFVRRERIHTYIGVSFRKVGYITLAWTVGLIDLYHSKLRLKEPCWSSRFSDWLQAKLPRSSSLSRVKNCLSSTLSRLALGPTSCPIQWTSWALSLGIKRPGREAHYSTAISAEIKKTWYMHPFPHTSSWRGASLYLRSSFRAAMGNLSYFGGQIIILSPSQGPD